MSKIKYEVMRYLGHTKTIIDLGEIILEVKLIDDTLIVVSMNLVNNVSPSKIESCLAKFRGWMSKEDNYSELVSTMLQEESRRDGMRVGGRSIYNAWRTHMSTATTSVNFNG